MNIKLLLNIWMIHNTYFYSFFIFFVIISLIYLVYNFRSSKNEISDKVVLKKLLESLDLELPDELKALDNSSADPPKYS